MIESFVITLREGVEAALVVAIAVAYIKRIGRPDLMPAVYRGLLTAVVASFIAAWGFAKIKLNEDAYEGWVLLISAAFVLSMVVWMNRHGAHVKSEIETGLQKGTSGNSAGWGVFAFVFLMIFREGVETVLFLAVLRLDTSGILEGLGAVLGMAGYFSGVVQAPMTAFVIILEMTGNDDNVIPLMLAAMLGYAASRLVAPEALYHGLAKEYE